MSYKVRIFEIDIEEIVPWLNNKNIQTICIPSEYRARDCYEIFFDNSNDKYEFERTFMN